VTAPSPAQMAGSVVAIQIEANGAPLNTSYQVVDIEIWTGVNRLPKARLVISDGDPAEGAFPISETAALIPGAKLSIGLGYGTDTQPVFSGVIYRQGLQVHQNGPSRLVVEATDQAMAMTLARSNAIFTETTDSAIITKLIEDTPGLSAEVSGTPENATPVVQYYASNWDLMLIRAQLNGMVVTVDDSVVTVAAPKTSTSPVLILTYGVSILDFQAEMDAATQFKAAAISSYAWDPAEQKLAKSGSATTSVEAPGNISSEDLAKVFGISAFPQQTAGTLAAPDLTQWSSAELMKTRLAKIRGTVRFQGSVLARTGAMVTLEGLGDRFNGEAYVGGVHHHVSADGKWVTTVEIGLSPDWFSATALEVQAPPAAGQLPAVANLQTGLVLKTDGDPAGEFRVQVQLPLLQAGSEGLWARLGSFYASNTFGAEFYPEVGDEVVVAFMNGDPRFPVIVGSLYSKKNPPPVTPDAKNNQKAIVTRSKLRLDFFEDLPSVKLSSPKQSIELDDKAGTITIKDANKNTVTMSSSGITLDSDTKITLTAKTDIAITAQGSLSLTGKTGVNIAGLDIKANADMSFAAQGAGEAKLTSDGILTIQGSLVKIN